MKYYIGDFNGILEPFKKKVGMDHLATPREADVWVTFQDCQGSYKDLIKTAKFLGICPPVYTIQHGRASTSDYAAPNSFPMIADKYLCWGTSDYNRLCELGYKDKAVIVGCPLNTQIKPKVEHKEKVILFVPVNTGKEEPENIAVYYELLRLKYKYAQSKVLNARTELKKKWTVNGSFNSIAQDFDVAAKLLPWHDRPLYHGNVLMGYQDSPKNNEILFNLLRNVDLVVGMDEGTTEIFAYGHDVPVVICDGFKYQQHPDGKTAVEIDPYKTDAAVHTDLAGLETAIDFALKHPEHKREDRRRVSEAELGTSYGDATANILNLIRKDFSSNV